MSIFMRIRILKKIIISIKILYFYYQFFGHLEIFQEIINIKLFIIYYIYYLVFIIYYLLFVYYYIL